MKWRTINEGNRYSEAFHQAIEEVLLEKMEAGDMRPTLRFWYRENPGVPIGRFQSYRDEVQHDYAEENGVEVVRRITGGGAMYCEPGNVITYSLYLPKDKVTEDMQESYRELDSFAVKTLNSIDVDASHEPLNDIEGEDGKLGGAAQLRKSNSVLHHTTMSYGLDIEEMLKVLRIGKEKVSDKAIKSAEKRVARIKDRTDFERQEVINELVKQFSEDREVVQEGLTAEEVEKAEEMVEEKFSTEEWNRKL